jgi:hypothetical protein
MAICYETGSANGAGATNNFFIILRDHLLANGWTQHDIISSAAGSREVVFRGAALDATADVRPFVKVKQTATAVLEFTTWSDYDVSTHTGMNSAGTTVGSATMTLQDAGFSYYLWIDGYGGLVCGKIGTSITRGYMGFARRGLDPSESGITKTTGALAIGATSLPVASDMTGKLRVGQVVLIVNYAHSSASANASNAEAVTITSVSSTAIGVSALTKAYDSGALVGDNVIPSLVSPGATAGLWNTAGLAPINPDGTRTAVNGQTVVSNSITFGTEANVDPGDISGRYGAGLITLTSSVSGKTDFKGHPRGVSFCAAGAQVIEDLMQSGSYSYVVLDVTAATGCTILGPREI